MALTVPEILKNAAERCDLDRVRFADHKAPTSADGVTAMTLFSDFRSTALASCMLMKRYREEAKGSKYFVLCSWPGWQGLFPYVDEYWAVRPSAVRSLLYSASGLVNETPAAVAVARGLSHYFLDVETASALTPFYSGGITQKFFDRFANVKCFKPALPSSAVLGLGFNRELSRQRGPAVFFWPSKTVYGWRNGRTVYTKVGPQFYEAAVRHFLAEGITPVVLQGETAHDLSGFGGEILYVSDTDMSAVMAAMRSAGCVVDFLNGLSRLAIIARCPFVSCDERNRFVNTKEFEFDDLCAEGVPREYIFSFSTIIGSGDETAWRNSLFDAVVTRVRALHQDADRDTWPSASETDEVVPYAKVRRKRAKKLGVQFLRPQP